MKNKMTMEGAKLYSSLTTKFRQFWMQSLQPKMLGVIREMEMWIGIRLVKVEYNNLNPYSETLSKRLGKTYQHQQKNRSYICVCSSADNFKLTHNEIAANIEKHQTISKLRWNDSIIEAYL